MIQKPIKPKKCKICKLQFTPARPLQFVCTPECGYVYAKQAREKHTRKEYRAAKEKMKSRADWLRETQVIFNKFIRMRDAKEPCISCRRYHEGQFHAGHYRSVGSTPELRFNEFNCHKQCSVCNNHLSGNAINYRINLVKKLGVEIIEWLEGKHEPKKYTIDDLKIIKSLYRDKIKLLSD